MDEFLFSTNHSATKKSATPRTRTKSYSSLEVDNSGFPLAIFTKGALLHPYLSLAYIDLLKSNRIRSYVFGATNALFKQRKSFFDVIVWEDEESKLMKIEVLDADLRRQLQLLYKLKKHAAIP